jgi:hypothetical protein
MYKYEMHLHSKQGSKCGVADSRTYVDFYIKNGYSGAVLTDHFYHGNTRPPKDIEWTEYMNKYLEGYYAMKEAAEGKDFSVFFGVEERFDTCDEYLIYGLEPEWYIAHPELRHLPRIEYLSLARESGAFIVQAHPYRYRHYYAKYDHLTISSSLVDAYEVFNSGNTPEHNKLAAMLAQKDGKPVIGGSDRHGISDEKTPGGIEVPRKADTIHDLIAMIKARENNVMGIETLDEVSENISPDLPIVFI